MTEKEIKIGSDKIILTLCPEIGGCITSFTYKGVNVLRTNPLNKIKKEGADASGGYAMIPYASEIKEGAFVYWGIKRTVSKTPEDAVNGEGRTKNWTVDSKSDTKITMSYKHEGNDGFPYPYTASQTIEVIENKVKITISATNNFELPMPIGYGYQPFFEKSADVQIQCKNRTVWAHEGLISISKPYKTPVEWSFDEMRALNDAELNTCFAGFDGKINIKYPNKKMNIEINAQDDFHHVYIANKPENNFFSISPASNAQDAFNLAARGIIGSGIKTLEPDETCEEIIEFTITD